MNELIEELRHYAGLVYFSTISRALNSAADALERYAEEAISYGMSVDNCEVLRARLARYEDAEGNPIAQPSGLVLPERLDFPHRDEFESADQYAAAIGESKKWNACLDEVARLNSSPVSSAPSHGEQVRGVGLSRESLTLAYWLITKELETLANGSAIDRFKTAQGEFRSAIAAAPSAGSQKGGE